VKSVSSKVLGGKQGTDSKILPMLTERRVVFDNGICTKTIIHLHYDGWYDNKTAPDEALFFLLIDRMIEQSPEHSFISVNCRAGVGRSGLVVVFFWLRKQIDAQLAAGVLPETISVNIPETIYALRRQRAGALGNPAQMTQVYDFLGDYYEPLLGR
jgi:protein tyrosine phosphatase